MQCVRNLAARYHTMLHRHPLPVKMATSGLIVGMADTAVQMGTCSAEIDIRRSLLFGIGYGSLTFAPALHMVTTTWQRILPSTAITALVTKSTVDMLTSFPFNISVAIVFQANLRGSQSQPSWKESYEAVQSNLWPSLLAGWAFWGPYSVVNYGFIPLHYRVLCLNIGSFGWNYFMVNCTPTRSPNL